MGSRWGKLGGGRSRGRDGRGEETPIRCLPTSNHEKRDMEALGSGERT